MYTPNVHAMHFARMMDTSPDYKSGEQAVRNNAAVHYTVDGTVDETATAVEVEQDMKLYQEGKADLQRFSLHYTGRAIVPSIVESEIPANAVASVRLDAGHIATSQAYRYAYALTR